MPACSQRRDAARRVAGGDDARIADHQRPPGSQLAGQLAQRVELVGAEDDPRSQLEVEGIMRQAAARLT